MEAKYKQIDIAIVRIPTNMINPKTGKKESYALEIPEVSRYQSGETSLIRLALQDEYRHLRNFIPKTTTLPDRPSNGFTQVIVDASKVQTDTIKVLVPNRDYTGITYPILACMARQEFTRNPIREIVAVEPANQEEMPEFVQIDGKMVNTDSGEIESEDTETVTETHDTETTETTMEATEKTQA